MAVAPPVEPSPTVPAAAPAPARLSRPAGFLRRLTIGVNVIIQMTLLAFILAAVNGYSYKHYHRFDFSRSRKYALSQRTKQFLTGMNKPVKIIVFMNPQTSLLQGDMARLSEEYRSTQSKFINIEQVDPLRNVTRASEVQNKYKLVHEENVIIVDGGDNHSQIITEDKLAEIDRSGEQFGQPPRITAFSGEQAITSALLEVTEGKKNSVGFLQGHGEPPMGKVRPLDAVSTLLEKEHLDVQELNLLNVPSVPAGTSVILLIGARYDLTDGEIKLLRDYWEKGGRLLVLLNPDAKLPHLFGFLSGLGVQPDDNRVVITQDLGGVTLFSRDAYANLTGSTPVAANLSGVVVPLAGSTESLTLMPERVSAANLRVEPLLQAFKGFWGETEYQDIQNTGAYYDKDKDKGAPLYVAATVQKGALQGNAKVQVNGARMVVVANSRFIESDVLDEKSWAFFDGTLNWLLERESLIGVQPKPINTITLNLPDEQLKTFFWATVLAIPGFCAFLGLLVWWRRRS